MMKNSTASGHYFIGVPLIGNALAPFRITWESEESPPTITWLDDSSTSEFYPVPSTRMTLDGGTSKAAID